MHKLSIPSLIAGTSILFSSYAPLYAEDNNHRQQGAHEHGSAKLQLATEGNKLEMEFISPAMNLIGFEHKPGNQQQHKAVRQAIDTLKAADKLFVLPAAAGCTLHEAEVETELAEDADHAGHGHDENKHEQKSHAEFHAHYHFRCTNIAALKQIDVQLFAYFPATHDLDVEMITSKGQKAVELNHDHNKLTL